MVGVLVACGPDRNRTGADGEESEKTEQLVIWENKESSMLNHTQKMAKEYEEKTGIKVKVVGVDLLKMQDKLTLDGPAGKGPDLVTWPHDRLGSTAITGLVQPIDIKQGLMDQYSESAIQAMTYDGKLYGLPYATESIALYYNKKLMKKIPKTWDELIQFAEENSKPSKKKYGFLFEGENFYYDYFLFDAMGGYVFRYQNGKYDVNDIGLNNKGSEEALKKIKELYEKKLIPQGLKADTVNGLFKEEKVAAVINGPWAIKDYESAGIDFGVIPLPKVEGKDPQTFIGVKGWYLSAFTNHKKASTDLMRFLSSKEALKKRYQATGEIPPHKELLQDPLIKDDSIVHSFSKQASQGTPMPNIPAMGQVWEPINNALSFVAQGKRSPEAALDESVKMIEEKIKAQKQ